MGIERKKKLSAISLWDRVVSASLRQRSSLKSDIKYENFYFDDIGFYNKENGVTFVYTLDGYPSEIETDLRYNLRSECKGDTRVSIISLFERHTINWNSPQMKNKLKSWKILDETAGDVDEYSMHNSIESMDTIVWRKQSLVYLNDAVLRRKRKTFRFRSLVLVTGIRGVDFDESILGIEDYCKQRSIALTRVLYNIPDYLEMYSPFRLTRNPKLEKEVGNVVATDEVLSRFTSFSQGKIGKMGDYWGTDIFSCFACLKPTKVKSTDAETWLITGETGSGKSYFGKGIIIQLLAKDEINGTINDVEGFEYVGLTDYVEDERDSVVILNFAEGEGLYRDPVPIPMTGSASLDKGMYALSVSSTATMFRTLVGEVEEGIATWIGVVIDEAIAIMYRNVGVSQRDMNTWHLADDSSIFDVYDVIKQMLEKGDAINGTVGDMSKLVYSNEDYHKALQVIIARLSRYFEEGGTLRSTFSKRVTLGEIAVAKLVINSFGMAGKSPDTVDKIQMALMQLYAANISHIRSIFSKAQGRFNFKVWEEFQRWGDFPNSDKIISTSLTGGRKLGDINIIMTNKVGDLLDNDRFGIFGNLTSVAIGCIWDSKVRHELCKRLSMLNFEEDLETLVKKNRNLVNYVDGDTVQDSAYSKAFLIGLDKTFYTISRMDLPEEWDSLSLFQTGVELKDSDNLE